MMTSVRIKQVSGLKLWPVGSDTILEPSSIFKPSSLRRQGSQDWDDVLNRKCILNNSEIPACTGMNCVKSQAKAGLSSE